MNARVAAYRAGFRRPRRYAVPTYDPGRDARWGRFVFGDCSPLVVRVGEGGGVAFGRFIRTEFRRDRGR